MFKNVNERKSEGCGWKKGTGEIRGKAVSGIGKDYTRVGLQSSYGNEEGEEYRGFKGKRRARSTVRGLRRIVKGPDKLSYRKYEGKGVREA